MNQHSSGLGLVRWVGAVGVLLLSVLSAQGESTDHQGFHVVTTDDKNIETELQRAVFYYEEKLSETSFIPHELDTLPVKRGSAVVQVKFRSIKEIEFTPGPNDASRTVMILLTNGKSGEFQLAIAGSFKGISEFGEVLVPVSGVKKVVFR